MPKTKHAVARSGLGTVVLNRRPVLPLVDGHTHIFGQSWVAEIEDKPRTTEGLSARDYSFAEKWSVESGPTFIQLEKREVLERISAEKAKTPRFAIQEGVDRRYSGQDTKVIARDARGSERFSALDSGWQDVGSGAVVLVASNHWPLKPCTLTFPDVEKGPDILVRTDDHFVIGVDGRVLFHGSMLGSPEYQAGLSGILEPFKRFAALGLDLVINNAIMALNEIPQEWEDLKLSLALHLDMGFCPVAHDTLAYPKKTINKTAMRASGTPRLGVVPSELHDYYRTDVNHICWPCDDDTFRRTLIEHAHAAKQNPGRLLTFVGFDPRRKKCNDFVKWAIEELGFAGVKLYSRCGYSLSENKRIYHEHIADRCGLDARLEDLFTYCEKNDIPILNHHTAEGWPPTWGLVLPRGYYRQDHTPLYLAFSYDSRKPDLSADLTYPPEMPDELLRARTLEKICHKALQEAAKRCHYIQCVSSPYAWEAVLEKHPKLRVCFGHLGAENAVITSDWLGIWNKAVREGGVHDNEENLDRTLPVSEYWRLRERKAWKDCIIGDEGLIHSAVLCGKEHFDKVFFELAVCLAHRIDIRMHQMDILKERYIRDAIYAILNRDIAWVQWRSEWKKAYPDSWLDRFLCLCTKYENVFGDLSYFSSFGKNKDREENKPAYETKRNALRTLFKALSGTTAQGKPWERAPWVGGEYPLEDKIIYGSDWYMIENDNLNGQAFWQHVDMALNRIPAPSTLKEWQTSPWRMSKPFSRKFYSINALKYLNLTSERRKVIENWLKRDEAKWRHHERMPEWWDALDMLYSEEEGDRNKVGTMHVGRPPIGLGKTK